LPGFFPEEGSLAKAQGGLHAAGWGLLQSIFPRHRGQRHPSPRQAGTRRATPFLCGFCRAAADSGITQLPRPQARGKALLTLLGVIAA